jgi:hypothetical protein
MKPARCKKKEWFDDSFGRELYPFMVPGQRFADADVQVANAVA